MKVPYSLRLVAAAFLVLLALPVSAQEFSNTDYIYSRAQTVTQGPALLYPAPLAVSTVPGNVTDLDVRINTLLHTWPDDLDMLLVAPDGTNMIIMSDAGGEADIANVTITLDDEAATQLSDDGPLVTGSFRPLNSGAGDSFAAPAPAPNLANVTLAAFDGVVANGTWNLYIMDDASGDYGSLVTGWALIINGTTINSATARPVPAHVTTLGAGDPYPSTIDVSGLPSTILDVNVRFDSLTHSFPDDFDVLLVGPDGTNIILASDIGGAPDVAGVVLTIDDEAASILPDATALVSGSFRPTNIGTGDTFTAPAPPGPYTNTALSVFDALNPNGTWSLYIMDDAAADQGAFSGGWSLIFEVTPPGPVADLMISEFRVRGPNGAEDEFIEIYNPGAAHTVAGGGTGYAIAASDGVARCVIPNGTIIPSGGHYLCVNSDDYSLASYPAGNGTTATGDATFTTDIPDNAGIAIFNTSIAGDFILANRMDAVGSTSEANTLYKEGTGYPALTPFSIDYSFYRDQCGKNGSITTFGQCDDYEPADTDNNAADFVFVDTNGTSAGAGQRLGAPGPQNLSAPLSHGAPIVNARLDECVLAGSPPNFVRDFTSDPANNSTFGTLDLRRTFTNSTGAALTRLRYRIVDLTTFPAPSGFADLRPRTSTAVVVTVDRTPCGSGTSNVTVEGTTLEQPPSQPNGSGFNGSMSSGTVTLGTPLANGGTIDVRFLLGIQQTGNFKFGIVVEALPGGSDTWYVEGNTETGIHDGALTLTGTEGWRMLSGAYTNQTYDDLLGTLWTQGFTGADNAGGGSNVFLYNEAVSGPRTAGYVSIANQADDIADGRGHFVYVFADDDQVTPGTQGGFPKVIPQEGAPLARAVYPFTPVTFTNTGALADDGWNLMGNPSAGTMNWDAAGWTKTNIDNTIYVWDNNAGGGAQYLTWNGTTGGLGNGLITRNQGFWVKATAISPVLEAPIAAFSQGGTFHGLTAGEGGEEAGRTEPAPTVAFRLEGTAGGHALGTNAYAVALPEAATGIDRYDAFELVPLVNTYLQLFGVATEGEVAGRPMDITAIPADLTGPVEIPLGARAVVGGTMTAAEVTMTWPTLANIPDTWTAQLLDRQTGAVIELRTETSYTFTLPAEGLLAPALEATTTTGLLPAGPTQMAAARGTTTDARLVLVFGPSATTGTEGLPTVYALHAIAPNPVGRAGTLVRFDMPEAANAQIEVYDMLGRRVAVLASGAHEAGRHAVRLDAEAIASGVYVVRMAAGDFVQAQRVTVTR